MLFSSWKPTVAIVAVSEARREALIEVAGGGVERRVQRPLMTAEEIARLGREPGVDVNRLEASLRGECQGEGVWACPRHQQFTGLG